MIIVGIILLAIALVNQFVYQIIPAEILENGVVNFTITLITAGALMVIFGILIR